MAVAQGREVEIHDGVRAVLARHQGRWSPQVIAMAIVPGPSRSEPEWLELLDRCEQVVMPALDADRARAKAL